MAVAEAMAQRTSVDLEVSREPLYSNLIARIDSTMTGAVGVVAAGEEALREASQEPKPAARATTATTSTPAMKYQEE